MRIQLAQLFEYKYGRHTQTLLKDYFTDHVFILTYWAGTKSDKPQYSLWEADEKSAADTIKMYFEDLSRDARIKSDIELQLA